MEDTDILFTLPDNSTPEEALMMPAKLTSTFVHYNIELTNSVTTTITIYCPSNTLTSHYHYYDHRPSNKQS